MRTAYYLCSTILLTIAFLGLLPQAKAQEPIGYLVSYLGGQLLDEVFDTATGKPDVRLLGQRLKELEKNQSLNEEMSKELQKLLFDCTNRTVTRDEFREMSKRVGDEMEKIKSRVDSLEERVERLEVETEDLKSGDKNGMSASYYAKRGEQFAEKQDFQRAIASFAIAIKIDPHCAEAYRGRCNIFKNRGAWGALLNETNQALGHVYDHKAKYPFVVDRILARARFGNWPPSYRAIL